MSSLDFDVNARMLAETSLCLGQEFFKNEKHKDFFQYMGMWTGKEQYEFLIRFAIAIEQSVHDEGGWDEIETHWVWDELVEATVRKLLDRYINYRSLDSLEADLIAMIRNEIVNKEYFE